MKIAIDMDGTLADFITPACAKARELWDIDLYPEDITEYSFAGIIQKKGVDLPKEEIYAALTTKGMFLDLDPLPGAVEAIRGLHDAGHDIVILTKTLLINRGEHVKQFSSDHAVSEKLDWLAKYFDGIPYSVIMVGNAYDKHLVNCHVVVDDDMRVLEHPTAITVCVAQPWNAEYREEMGEFLTIIEHMSELPDMVTRVEKILMDQELGLLDTLEKIQKKVGIDEVKIIKSGICDCGD